MAHGDFVPLPEDTQRTAPLLAGYLAGDRDAARRFFERFRAELVARAERHPLLPALGPTVSAEDVAQEVLYRVTSSRSFERFVDHGSGSVGNFLGQIVENTLIDLARRQSSQKRGGARPIASLDAGPDDTGAREQVHDPAPTPTSDVRAREYLELGRIELSDREWYAWSRREIEKAPAHEVAAHLGVTPAALHSIVHRSRLKLIRALRERGEASP